MSNSSLTFSIFRVLLIIFLRFDETMVKCKGMQVYNNIKIIHKIKG